jgi:hypothetical protein
MVNKTQHNDTQHNSRALLCSMSFMLTVTYVERHITAPYAECRHAECRGATKKQLRFIYIGEDC